jgi:hypothetical protein
MRLIHNSAEFRECAGSWRTGLSAPSAFRYPGGANLPGANLMPDELPLSDDARQAGFGLASFVLVLSLINIPVK